MAKSRATGDKRRREREKQLKRMEKAERRQQRKADKDAGLSDGAQIVTLDEITGDPEDSPDGKPAEDEDEDELGA